VNTNRPFRRNRATVRFVPPAGRLLRTPISNGRLRTELSRLTDYTLGGLIDRAGDEHDDRWWCDLTRKRRTCRNRPIARLNHRGLGRVLRVSAFDYRHRNRGLVSSFTVRWAGGSVALVPKKLTGPPEHISTIDADDLRTADPIFT